jgi:hypothetical protein
VFLVAVTPGTALAHGDPASHYLESDVLYPAFGDPPSDGTELKLLGLLHAARDAGYPLGVALVANEADLTDDPSMLTRPQDYAEYVVAELGRSRPTSGPVLVLTPAGYGLAGAVAGADGRIRLISRAEAADDVATLPAVGAGGEAMAQAAIVATRLLAASAGHPLPKTVPPAQPLRSRSTSAAGGSGLDWRLPVGVFLGVMIAAVGAYEVQRRFSAADVPG